MNNVKHYILLFFTLFLCNIALSQVLIELNSEWSYFKGYSEPSDPQSQWTEVSFDASSWLTGNAPFRYGDGEGGTHLTDMFRDYTTLYIRKEFEIASIDDIDKFFFSVDYDDGFVMWINGKEILKDNVTDNYAYDSGAPSPHESGVAVKYTIKKNDLELVNGKNVICIQGFNVSNTSSDFLLNASLEAVLDVEEADGATCDTPSGFFKNPIYVKILSNTNGETVKYTLDGSDPRYSSTALLALTPATVQIDPNSATGERGKTGAVVLRASRFEDGLAPSKPLTRTYIYTSSVLKQTDPNGGGWPTNDVNGQLIDLKMDAKVTFDPRYKNHLETALLDLPSISVTTDIENLFGSGQGIYVNANFHGEEWERPANIELINPDGTPGFNEDAGLRIRGGWSRHDGYPKHAFRLFFKTEYGKGKLDYPLFGKEGTERFDKIDLRTTQNYSWANGGGNGKHNTMNRDVFSRETQRDMNQPYTRSRYYHLYLNGIYWGVYQTQERGEAAFADTYFGGSKDDYDVIKVDIGENWNLYEIEATDGNLDAWRDVWDLCVRGFEDDQNYFKLIGKNYMGEVDTSVNLMVDIDNLIDYMLVIFYAGNFDSPCSKFSGNRRPNNFFVFKNRTRKREGFRFLAHDAEHTLLTEPVGPGIGLEENRVNIGHTNSKINVTRFEEFHPQWLHHKLTANKEYRIRFADRVYKHFFNSGVFIPDSCISRFKSTSDQLEYAIIAESARWGDSKGRSNPRDKEDDWLPSVNQVINDYMPFRTDIVYNQLVDEGLVITEMDPPVFKNNNVELKQQKITIEDNFNLLMKNENPAGIIYYTTDGTDPRNHGGSPAQTAVDGGKEKTINIAPGTVVKARTAYMDDWSAVHEIYFEDSGLFSNLKVTELHYHPLDQGETGGKEFEFIEFKNIGDKTLDLSGLTFSDGITFTFPEGSTVAPNSFVVLASNDSAFTSFYGFAADYQFSGSLSNGGEKIDLKTVTGKVVVSFTFSDDEPWPKEADGDGYSLVAANANPTGNPDSVIYWTISKYENGSPLADDEVSITDTKELLVENNIDFNLYPNPASSSVYIDFSLSKSEDIEVGLYDLNGRLLQQLVHEKLPSGMHSKFIPLNNLNSGIYLVVFRGENSLDTQKLILNN